MDYQFPILNVSSLVYSGRVTYTVYIQGQISKAKMKELQTQLGLRLRQVGLSSLQQVKVQQSTFPFAGGSSAPALEVTVTLTSFDEAVKEEASMYEGIIYVLAFLLAQQIIPPPPPLL